MCCYLRCRCCLGWDVDCDACLALLLPYASAKQVTHTLPCSRWLHLAASRVAAVVDLQRAALSERFLGKCIEHTYRLVPKLFTIGCG
jgi:hypothetical protein